MTELCVRNLYNRIVEVSNQSINIQHFDEDNTGIEFLRLVKKGDLAGIEFIIKKLKKLDIENIYDDFGEVEFSDSEVEALLRLF